MTKFAEPEPEALIQALSDAIPICKYHDPHSFHAGESRALWSAMRLLWP
jgi:hypothetical protein